MNFIRRWTDSQPRERFVCLDIKSSFFFFVFFFYFFTFCFLSWCVWSKFRESCFNMDKVSWLFICTSTRNLTRTVIEEVYIILVSHTHSLYKLVQSLVLMYALGFLCQLMQRNLVTYIYAHDLSIHTYIRPFHYQTTSLISEMRNLTPLCKALYRLFWYVASFGRLNVAVIKTVELDSSSFLEKFQYFFRSSPKLMEWEWLGMVSRNTRRHI